MVKYRAANDLLALNLSLVELVEPCDSITEPIWLQLLEPAQSALELNFKQPGWQISALTTTSQASATSSCRLVIQVDETWAHRILSR